MATATLGAVSPLATGNTAETVDTWQPCPCLHGVSEVGGALWWSAETIGAAVADIIGQSGGQDSQDTVSVTGAPVITTAITARHTNKFDQ